MSKVSVVNTTADPYPTTDNIYDDTAFTTFKAKVTVYVIMICCVDMSCYYFIISVPIGIDEI